MKEDQDSIANGGRPTKKFRAVAPRDRSPTVQRVTDAPSARTNASAENANTESDVRPPTDQPFTGFSAARLELNGKQYRLMGFPENRAAFEEIAASFAAMTEKEKLQALKWERDATNQELFAELDAKEPKLDEPQVIVHDRIRFEVRLSRETDYLGRTRRGIWPERWLQWTDSKKFDYVCRHRGTDGFVVDVAQEQPDATPQECELATADVHKIRFVEQGALYEVTKVPTRRGYDANSTPEVTSFRDESLPHSEGRVQWYRQRNHIYGVQVVRPAPEFRKPHMVQLPLWRRS